MAKLTVVGRLGQVKYRGQNNEYVSFGVAEPSYQKPNSSEYITPWFNFLVKADKPVANFLMSNAAKIDVVQVEANERQDQKDGNTIYYHNVTSVDVISWKKADVATTEEYVADQAPAAAPEDDSDDLPWMR